MPRLEMEITDKMMKRLQERADTYTMKPSDIAKWILACELAKREKTYWADKLGEVVAKVSDAVIAISKTEIHNKRR